MTVEAARLLSVPSSRWFQLGHRGVWHAKLRRPGSWISAAIAQNCVAPMHPLGEIGFVNEPGRSTPNSVCCNGFPMSRFCANTRGASCGPPARVLLFGQLRLIRASNGSDEASQRGSGLRQSFIVTKIRLDGEPDHWASRPKWRAS